MTDALHIQQSQIQLNANGRIERMSIDKKMTFYEMAPETDGSFLKRLR